jgi:hypothetical protein
MSSNSGLVHNKVSLQDGELAVAILLIDQDLRMNSAYKVSVSFYMHLDI